MQDNKEICSLLWFQTMYLKVYSVNVFYYIDMHSYIN